MDWNIFPSQQMSSFDESREQHDKVKDAKFTTEDAVSNARRRRHSSSSGTVPRHAISLSPLEATLSREERVNGVQDATSTAANAAFVGLHRRRKISLPSSPVLLKPDQFLEGGRVELAKRQVNLDAHMPVFNKEPGSVKKCTTTPLRKTDANGWMFEDTTAQGRLSVNQGPRQRRISLPVLKVDRSPDSQPLTGYNSASAGELNNNLLSPSCIPHVQSGPLIAKKTETRQWNQRF